MEQLLDVATSIVRAGGVDTLTLARVAEEAGVSKPIAYSHFGTRSGLLKALLTIDSARRCALRSNASVGDPSLYTNMRTPETNLHSFRDVNFIPVHEIHILVLRCIWAVSVAPTRR